jgi:putative methyltransferase (TIGR04325 family)
MLEKIHRAVERAARWPGVYQLRRSRFDHGFARGGYGGVCRGIFASYEEAAAAAPRSLPLGYDNPQAAAMYRDRITQVFPSDYPMMLWLAKMLDSGVRRVFDLGGHVGISYYAYQQFLSYPQGLSWQVCDVPAVVQAGLSLAASNDRLHKLEFTDRFEQADGADLLFTSGCVQYLEDTLAQRVSRLNQRPKWILVNLLPLHEQHAFWTVQSIGRAFCPYRIQQAQIFFADLERLGYEVLDKWENLEKRCEIAFEPDYSLDKYFGAALRLKDMQQNPSASGGLHIIQ